MHVAVLLGADGYRRPDAVYAYLQSVDHTRSPIAVRALLTVLRDHCDGERAEFLVGLCIKADPFLRRAVIDLIWKNLNQRQRATLTAEYEVDFERDPFLRNLVGNDYNSPQASA